MAEIRKIKPTRAEMYGRIEAGVDADGETLVLEFPADQEFAMELAEDPDMRELLQRALGAVMGAAPPVRFKLSTVAPRAPHPAPEVQKDEPGDDGRSGQPDRDHASGDDDGPEYFETASAPHPWAADAAPEPSVEGFGPAETGNTPDAAESTASGDLTRQLMESLGAEIVEQRPADASDD